MKERRYRSKAKIFGCQFLTAKLIKTRRRIMMLMLGRTLVLERYPRFMDLIIIGYERNQGERTRSILDGPFTNEERKA
jgi:hypothetical protein